MKLINSVKFHICVIMMLFLVNILIYDKISVCDADYSSSSFCVVENGLVSVGGMYSSFGARPTFSLLSSVTYVSGDGSQSSPITLVV